MWIWLDPFPPYTNKVNFQATCITSDSSCADPGIFPRGGPGQCDKKKLWRFFLFFLVLNIFQGGVQLFPGGGGGSNCLIPIETYITCDFPGGVWTPCPPSGSALVVCIPQIKKLPFFCPFMIIAFTVLSQRWFIIEPFITKVAFKGPLVTMDKLVSFKMILSTHQYFYHWTLYYKGHI